MRGLLSIAIAGSIAALPATALELNGALKQGGLVIGKVDPGARVWLDGTEIKVAPDGRFVIGFAREARPRAILAYTTAAGGREERDLAIAAQNYRIDRVDGLPPATVTIPPEEQARRERETALVAEARATESDMTAWAAGFALPVEGARVTGVYGSQRILNGEPRWPHYGLDLAAPVGTPVMAPANGVVRLAEPDFLLEGGIVIIDHGFGVISTLMHLNSVDVIVGQTVHRGDVVATLGMKGRANGPHLDWRINWHDVRVDPALAPGIVLPDGE